MGISLLLIVGFVHWYRTRGTRPSRSPGRWSTQRIVLCYVALIAVALAMRMALGLTHLPAFVDNDEATTGIAARALGREPYDWFGTWWVGIPNIAIVVTRLAELAFGNNLWGIRMGGVVVGVITIICYFDLCRRLAGDLPGFVAALLLAVAHVHVHWSRNGQIFIQTPAAAAIMLWLFVRAWTGGSLLAWIGAGVALGIGTQTYQASYILPALLLLTAIGWTVINHLEWKRVAQSVVLMWGIAALLLAPMVTTMLREGEHDFGRPATLSIFKPGNLALLGQAYRLEDPTAIVLEHLKHTALIFNTGSDFYPNYQAGRSFVDCVTAALVPLAGAMLLAQIFSSVGWLCWTWTAAYLTMGVLLCAHPPAYHRIPTVLLASSLAVAWALAQLAETIQEGLRLPRRTVPVICLAVALAAGIANAQFYFHEFRLARPTYHNVGFTWLLCRYARTHTVIDATIVDGVEYVPGHNLFPTFECPGAKRIRCQRSADLWKIREMTHDQHVALIVPQPVVVAHPGLPEGYRIVRRVVDDSVRAPVKLTLVVYELERLQDGDARRDDE